MTDSARTPSWREHFPVAFAAGLVLLGFTFVNFLNYNSYPLLTRELGYFYAGLVLLCGAMAALYAGQRLWGRAFLEALLIAVVIDLNLDSLWLTGAALLATFVFVVVTRRSLLPFAAGMGSVMLILNLVGFGERREPIATVTAAPPARAVSGQSPGPAIVHLIFDEHTGFEGFPPRSAAAAKMKSELRNFYGSRGFAMFGRAYSEHYYTANSIPQILNLGGPTPRPKNPKDFVSVRESSYLKTLQQRGYALRLYQNQFLNFCEAAAPVSCTTYDYSSLLPVRDTSLSGNERAQLILFKFLALSDVLLAVNAESRPLLGRLSPPEPIHQPLERLGLTTPIAAFAVLDRLADDLRNAKAGEAYIAHLLVPHIPAVVDRNCKVLPLKDWDRRIIRIPEQQRETAYYDQMRCTIKKTDQLLRSLAQSPAGANSIVIVHGDHGSRLWEVIPDKTYHRSSAVADYLAAFSTLFTVKSPQIGPAYVEAPASVPDLLRQLSDSHFRLLPKPAPGPPMVYLADSDWRPWKRVMLPPSWWKDSVPTSEHGSGRTSD